MQLRPGLYIVDPSFGFNLSSSFDRYFPPNPVPCPILVNPEPYTIPI